MTALAVVQTDHLFPQARLSRDEPMLWNFELMQTLRYQVGWPGPRSTVLSYRRRSSARWT